MRVATRARSGLRFPDPEPLTPSPCPSPTPRPPHPLASRPPGAGVVAGQPVKMSSGRKAETTKLGTSTSSLILRSTATLQIA